MVNNYVSNQEKKELLEIFKALDTNGDGTLSRAELMKGKKIIYIYIALKFIIIFFLK